MKTKNFAIKRCPLCNTLLRLFYSYNDTRYWCPTPKSFLVSAYPDSLEINHLNSHYYVKFSNSVIQKFYVQGYIVESVKGTNTSKIYTLDESLLYNGCIIDIDLDGTYHHFKTKNVGPTTFNKPEEPFKFLMEIPMIVPEDPEKLVKKIKLLTPFI
jgi:hypothetical protein